MLATLDKDEPLDQPLAQRLHKLRQYIAAHESRSLKQKLHCPSLDLCLPKPGLAQVAGFGKTEVASQILKDHLTHRTAWIEDKFSLYPPALTQRSINQTKILFAEAGSHILWTTLQIVRSQVFSLVFMKCPTPSENELRKLQLACEQSDTCLIHLSREPDPLWPFALVLNSSTTGLKILRQKG